MTLTGAIKELHELRSAEDMPIYYKPAIAEVINVLLMDTQEVKHGRWIEHHEPFSWMGYTTWTCSECDYEVGYEKDIKNRTDYCPNCGTDMREVEE